MSSPTAVFQQVAQLPGRNPQFLRQPAKRDLTATIPFVQLRHQRFEPEGDQLVHHLLGRNIAFLTFVFYEAADRPFQLDVNRFHISPPQQDHGMLHKGCRIATAHRLYHLDGHARAQGICLDKIDDGVQQKPLPSAQSVADQIG